MPKIKAVDSGNLNRAVAKLRRHDGRVWCAYLTPSEILALIGAGAQASNGWAVEWAKRKMASGEAQPTWFYCQLGNANAITKLIGRRKD